MATKKIDFKVRAMTIDEFGAFLDESEKVEQEVKNQTRRGFKLAKWVIENVYKVETNVVNGMTPGTMFDIFMRTQRMSEKSQLDELKN